MFIKTEKRCVDISRLGSSLTRYDHASALLLKGSVAQRDDAGLASVVLSCICLHNHKFCLPPQCIIANCLAQSWIFFSPIFTFPKMSPPTKFSKVLCIAWKRGVDLSDMSCPPVEVVCEFAGSCPALGKALV
mmetsp:Transcript_34491/g.77780  ORF Transcript_34491/g.77780 Transcript_34491/m.77780 type:complete len:132 (+) Transcript_34491:93-488(+)